VTISRTIGTAVTPDPCVHSVFARQDVTPNPLTYRIAYGASPATVVYGDWEETVVHGKQLDITGNPIDCGA